MLSIVLYGRNDSHGYNLHKRAALSLNGLAHLLGAPDDEIVFVDYNTPVDLPTFPEAIADTLTAVCKARLRVLRVTPEQHAPFAAKTDLGVLEPVARNVGFRRCNPNNAWALSTNTDMLFMPHAPLRYLHEIVAPLKPGSYALPRFEMPDLLWELLDRADPAASLARAADWGARYHINEIVEKPKEMLFDNPGDFQLFPRDAIFAIDGFDEAHLLGWHLDANLARRLYLYYGQTQSLEAQLSGWHCNHTRSQSTVHSANRKANDYDEVFTHVLRPDLPHQRAHWGLAGQKVEEARV